MRGYRPYLISSKIAKKFCGKVKLLKLDKKVNETFLFSLNLSKDELEELSLKD